MDEVDEALHLICAENDPSRAKTALETILVYLEGASSSSGSSSNNNNSGRTINMLNKSFVSRVGEGKGCVMM